MPGIAGIVGEKRDVDNKAALETMVDCTKHETFYTSGSYVNDRLGLWVGWAIHSGSFCDCLPLWNENRDICLIFSGEEYTDPCEIGWLRARGHLFNSEDASYLVHLYEERGSAFLKQLNGVFSGVVADLRQRKILLFNDRYGLNRIYYHENGRGFYFASEAKSLLRILPGARRLDEVGFGEFLSCGCVLQNRSLFSGLSLLPGGSAWNLIAGKPVSKASFFDRSTVEHQPRLGCDEYYERLRGTWARVLPRYFRGPRPSAMSLTGGLDGRMIMAYGVDRPGTLPCYTFGSMYRDSADVAIARKVAAMCQQPHTVITVGAEFLRDFPALAEKTVYISDGAMDVTGSVELFVNRLGRQIAPVRITGNYGSEILRGNVAFRPHPLNNRLFDPELRRQAQVAAVVYAAEAKGNRVSFIAFKQVPWFHRARLTLEQSQLSVRSPYLDNDLVALAYRGVTDPAGGTALALRLVAEGNANVGRIATDRGLEFRAVPLLTAARHNFMEFTFKAEYAYDYGMPQFVASIDHRLAFLGLERLFLGRHKFYHFRVWYRDELSKYVKEMLLDERTLSRPYFTRSYVEKVVNDHLRGVGNYTLEIHQLLTCELIQRQLIEQN